MSAPKVVALVGKAGTGKSHMAFSVAQDLEVDAIIDDGLLIHGSRIVAGRSAKREETGLAAIRRAIFLDPAHASEVREALSRIHARAVLVLATSEGMARRITDALGLPEPDTVLAIEDVSSPESIMKALRTRREEGKHVVPAPTFEVKRSFSGYLVDPLRLFLKSRAAGGRMVEKSVVRPTFSSLGKFFIADSVLSALAAHTANKVNGVGRVLRVVVEKRPQGIAVKLDVSVYLGAKIPVVLQEIQRSTREVIERSTALNVIFVGVTAKRIVLPESSKR